MGLIRRRARRRVLVAGATGAAAYHYGKKHGERETDEPDSGQSEPATDYAPAPPADTGPDAGDLDQIQRLAELHKSGALTDEEFAAAKAKLLS